MSRIRPSLSTILIVLPYVLLSAAIWLEYLSISGPGSLFWQVDFRWPLRAFYLGAVILGWRARRPSWFYSWLGFAVLESVFMLIDFSDRLPGAIDADGREVFARHLSNGLGFLAIVLYLLVPLWAGWRRPRSLVSAYTVFPHAALTFPLFLFSLRLSSDQPFFWVMAILSAGVSAAAALLFWSPPAFLVRAGEAIARGVVLYAGVLLAQSTLWVGFGLIMRNNSIDVVRMLNEAMRNDGIDFVRSLNQSMSLGWLLLSGAVLLPFLARALISLVKFSVGRVFRGATRDLPYSNDNRKVQNVGRDES